LTVTPTTVARPDIAVGDDAALRHTGHTGAGGWTRVPQSSQPWMRNRPSAPDVQNQPFQGSSFGSGRTVTIGSPLD
jgi:hypothetical protein